MHHNDALTAEVVREGKSQNPTRKTDVWGTRHLSAGGRSPSRGIRGGRGRGGLGLAGGLCCRRDPCWGGGWLGHQRDRTRRQGGTPLCPRSERLVARRGYSHAVIPV